MISVDLQKKLSSQSGEMNLVFKTSFPERAFVTLYGPSGSGKTSILRMVAGLLNPDSGKITINGKTYFDSNKQINLSPQKRKLGFVFQDYALFPNMTVEENLRIALPKNADDGVITELIKVMEIGQLKNRKPSTLSGGQQQRVALARSLVSRPKILLLDEPLSALDLKMRKKLQAYLLVVHRSFKLTTILVSHDIAEITTTSDIVVKLDEGKIISQGPSKEVLGFNNLSGKFRFTGEVINIKEEEHIFIITVLIGRDMVKIIADEESANQLNIGDQVVVASKAFNPIIKKMN
jgi:molybdate transport system ATP-binding protein